MGDFIRRRSSAILFVIIIIAGFLGFRRTEDIAATARQLAQHNRELTHQLEATVKQRRVEICAAETDTRQAVRVLLLGITDDFTMPGRVSRFELERRINEALGPPPANCP